MKTLAAHSVTLYSAGLLVNVGKPSGRQSAENGAHSSALVPHVMLQVSASITVTSITDTRLNLAAKDILSATVISDILGKKN